MDPASPDSLTILIEEIQDSSFFRSYKKRDDKISEIHEVVRTMMGQGREREIYAVAKASLKGIYLSVRFKRLSFSTFYKLIEALQVYNHISLFNILQDNILAFVRENKYKAQWFIILLLKVKKRVDDDTSRLEDIYLSRYLSPSGDRQVVNSNFLKQYIEEIPYYDKSKLFRHCVKHRICKDSFGKNLLQVFYDICPEYKKFELMN